MGFDSVRLLATNKTSEEESVVEVDVPEGYVFSGGQLFFSNESGDLKRYQFRFEPSGRVTAIEG